MQGKGSNFQLSFIWLKLLCSVTGALQFQFSKWRMKESINLAEIHITGLCAKQKWNQTVQSVKYRLRRRGEYARNSSLPTSLLQLNKL